MSQQLALQAAGSTVLEGSGDGAVQLGPAVPGVIWYPQVASVGADETTITDEAQCKIYVGPTPTQPYYVDGTLSGSTGDSTSNVAGQAVYPGWYVWAVWAGGDNGATVWLNVSGTRQVP
jgi:hypothetical protein